MQVNFACIVLVESQTQSSQIQITPCSSSQVCGDLVKALLSEQIWDLSAKMRKSLLFNTCAQRHLISRLSPYLINTVERLGSKVDGFSKLVDWKHSKNEISKTEASPNSLHLLYLPPSTNLILRFV